VFHQGALPSVPRSVQDPLTTSAVNVEGTLNVLLAARDEGVRRVVFASSSSVYGNCGELPRVESQNPDPISPYGVSKLAAERYCVSFARVYPLETVALRYFNVFGPNQDPTSQYAAVVPRFVTAVAEERPISVYGNGDQKRDFTFVANVVDANLLAADGPGVSGRVLNVATGRATSVNELADTIGAVLGKEVEREFHPERTGDVRDSWAEIGRARELLGWQPRIDLEEGLRIVADTFLERVA
jgi:UDP-glucose 4-epimerase